jgi:hypothetical protein
VSDPARPGRLACRTRPPPTSERSRRPRGRQAPSRVRRHRTRGSRPVRPGAALVRRPHHRPTGERREQPDRERDSKPNRARARPPDCRTASLSRREFETAGKAKNGGARIRESALLAQLAEHLHGKEGVDGSSPSEGFEETPANRRISFTELAARIEWRTLFGHAPLKTSAETDRFRDAPAQPPAGRGQASRLPRVSWSGRPRRRITRVKTIVPVALGKLAGFTSSQRASMRESDRPVAANP